MSGKVSIAQRSPIKGLSHSAEHRSRPSIIFTANCRRIGIDRRSTFALKSLPQTPIFVRITSSSLNWFSHLSIVNCKMRNRESQILRPIFAGGIRLGSDSDSSVYPACGRLSQRGHGRFICHMSDLPWRGSAVMLRHKNCGWRIFYSVVKEYRLASRLLGAPSALRCI